MSWFAVFNPEVLGVFWGLGFTEWVSKEVRLSKPLVICDYILIKSTPLKVSAISLTRFGTWSSIDESFAADFVQNAQQVIGLRK